MNAEIFAEWLRRQGHKVYKTRSSYWFDAAPRILQAFPYHWIITPDKDEIHEMMFKHGIIAMRYSAPPDHHEGKMSYHIVLNKCYDIHSVKHQARNGVKRGLENFTVEEITFDRLKTEGWVLQEDTLIRQRRQGIMSQRQWDGLCSSAKELTGFHAFGAISGKQLAGALIVCQIDDMFTVPYSMSHCRYLHDHVNNALFFAVSCMLLKREKVEGIFFCVESLDAPENCDEFKLRMGFEPKIVRQNVAIHPLLKSVVTPSVYSLNRKLLEYFPSNPYLAKSAGMMRFYLEGRRPLNEQNFHSCLKDRLNLINGNAQLT
jgi:hypothetical protein